MRILGTPSGSTIVQRLAIFMALIATTALLLAIAPGEKAADFTLKNYDGSSIQLSLLAKEKAVVVIFVSTKCPVSNAYNERIEALHKAFSGKGIRFVGVNSNRRETVDKIKAHAAENGLTFPIVKDGNSEIADKFSATYTPEVYVLGTDLTVLYHGRIDDSQREAHVRRQDLSLALEAIAEGKAVERSDTKAFGCSIKRALN